MKKLLIGISLALAIVICLCMPYWVDDFACAKYHTEIEDLVSSVDGIKVTDSFSYCGNLHNGNHTSKIVVVLVETELTITELTEKFSDAVEIAPFSDLSKWDEAFKRFSEQVAENENNNYVITYSQSAPFYYLDFRGH